MRRAHAEFHCLPTSLTQDGRHGAHGPPHGRPTRARPWKLLLSPNSSGAGGCQAAAHGQGLDGGAQKGEVRSWDRSGVGGRSQALEQSVYKVLPIAFATYLLSSMLSSNLSHMPLMISWTLPWMR